MKTKTLIATAALVALPFVAQAADLPMKAPMVAPAPVQNWTGFYVGAHFGGSWGSVESSLDAGVSPLFLPASFPGPTGNTNGILGGGQIGYNWQTGILVLGVQGDFAGIDNKGSAGGVAAILSPAAVGTAKSNWLATVSGRVGGVVLNNILVYAKGGGAWLNRDYSLTDPLAGISASATSTRSGWLAGFGTEYAFTRNWTGFIEYDYMDFGSKSIAFGVSPIGITVPVTITDRLNVVKAGVNYKF